MGSPLFPFASCAFQAPCWAPNRPLLHSGPVPCAHPPTARSQVPLHLLPTHRAQSPKRVLEKRDRGAFRGRLKTACFNSRSPNTTSCLPSPPPQRALCAAGARGRGLRWPRQGVGKRKRGSTLHPPHSPPGEARAPGRGQRPSLGGGVGEEERVPLWMEARPGMRLTLKSGSIRRIGGCGVYKNLGGLGLDERDDLLGEGQVLLG